MVKIRTRLCKDVGQLDDALGSAVSDGCDVVVLLSLGVEAASLVPFARSVDATTPVLLADCYGILGFCVEEGRNRELMEAGCGTEYGGVGGDGGRGVVGVVYSGGGAVGTTDALPTEVTSHLVVAAHGSSIASFLQQQATAVYYGGLAKAALRYDARKELFEPVPHIFVSTRRVPDVSLGTTSFTSDARGAVRQLLDRAPGGSQVEAVALFPCFMRGKNTYGKNNVEPAAISELLPGVPIFGMFCHGELGPKGNMGFDTTKRPQQSCTQHSMTSIVAVHLSAPPAG